MRATWLAAAVMSLPLCVTGQAIVTINVVSAADYGCSDDGGLNSADLRVSVFINDELALQTVKYQGSDAPLYGEWTRTYVPPDSAIRVIVEEAEPGGFFWLGTDWVPCDVAPGPAQDLEVSYNGGLQIINAHGDSGNAAAATVVIGPGAPSAAAISVAREANRARISWDGWADATSHLLEWESRGELARDQGGPGAAVIEGLCDNYDYQARLVRFAGPWAIGTRVDFQTTDVAPRPPTIVAVERDHVSWWAEAHHDLASFSVYGGPTGFEVDAANLLTRARGDDTSARVRLSRDIQEVRVEAVDHAGHSAISEPLGVGKHQAHPVDGCSALGGTVLIQPTYGGGPALADNASSDAPAAEPEPAATEAAPTDREAETQENETDSNPSPGDEDGPTEQPAAPSHSASLATHNASVGASPAEGSPPPSDASTVQDARTTGQAREANPTDAQPPPAWSGLDASILLGLAAMLLVATVAVAAITIVVTDRGRRR